MVPFEVFSEQLPAISAQLGVQESTLRSFLTTAGPFAQPVASGPHFPGALLQAGFGVVKEIYFANLDVGVVEKLKGGNTIVPASVAFETTDTAGGAGVIAAGAVIAGNVFGN